MQEPDLEARLEIALEHLTESLAFYGEALGLKIFRKHLGWYVETAPLAMDSVSRRAAKARLCRMSMPREVETALSDLFVRDKRLLVA